MVDKRKHLSRQPVRCNAVLPRYVLAIRTIELLITFFYKKTSQDRTAYLKQWEREKIINFGLGAHHLQQSISPAKDVDFSSWDREKVTNFGLTEFHDYKKSSREHFSPKQKQTHSDIKPENSRKINPQQIKKKEREPVSFNSEKAVDDFFKILGYE